jgi:hypothetical protein
VYLFKFKKKNVCFLPFRFLVFFSSLLPRNRRPWVLWKVEEKWKRFARILLKELFEGNEISYFFNFLLPFSNWSEVMFDFFHLLISFSPWKGKIRQRHKKKHFILFTVEVDKRIFDVYVFIQFGILLMWLWCGIQFFKGNGTTKRTCESFKDEEGKGREWNHMNTIHQNKSNTYSSTFNMKHIAECFDGFSLFFRWDFEWKLWEYRKLSTVVTESSYVELHMSWILKHSKQSRLLREAGKVLGLGNSGSVSNDSFILGRLFICFLAKYGI